jgi:NAD(P)-dependent dehydrogenase (short-subunit alcohol dehydrogenase family)
MDDVAARLRKLQGKVAVVTGGASGIGFGIAEALGQAGMRIVLADISRDAVEQACRRLQQGGIDAAPVVVDVSDAASMGNAAEAVKQRCGGAHVLVNNAGIAFHGQKLDEISEQDWQWVLGVNVLGVIHGVRSFLPLIRAAGEGGHIVNTASGSGFFVRAGRDQGAYSVSKYAVVAYTEALEQELAGSGIGVSLLSPGAVNTAIHRSGMNRPVRFGGAVERPGDAALKPFIERAMAPSEVGRMVLDGIAANRFYIFTHATLLDLIEERHARIRAAFAPVPDRKES